MRTSEHINELATALAKAQAEMKNAKLNKVNPHFKSRYADLAEIRDTVTPALSKNGIAVVHGMERAETGIDVVTRLIHASGQWVESRFPIAMDKPQAMASGITYGRRYNLSAIANISADDDDDANAANEKPATPPQKTTKPLSVHTERTYPGPDTAELTGTEGAPSNAAAKELFATLTREMEQAKTVESLKEWLKLRRPDVDKLPEKWMGDFENAYFLHKDSLAGVAV
jgi:hypothetical protein